MHCQQKAWHSTKEVRWGTWKGSKEGAALWEAAAAATAAQADGQPPLLQWEAQKGHYTTYKCSTETDENPEMPKMNAFKCHSCSTVDELRQLEHADKSQVA